VVTLPEGDYSHGGRIDLGYLLDHDVAYVNGTKVGESAYDPKLPGQSVYRAYGIPAAVLHEGINVILVRAFAHSPARLMLGIGGMALSVNGPPGSLPVKTIVDGDWQYWIESQIALSPESRAALPVKPDLNAGGVPASLYDGMIAPLGKFAMRGAIWYQGEANAGAAAKYPALMTHLIAGWRKQWGDEFPFYIVQLPLYQDGHFPAMRQAEAEIAATVPKTGLAVTIDTGEAKNIHPVEKRPVGERLALLALHRVYGEKIEDSGPVYVSAERTGGKLRIKLAHAEGLHATAAAIPNFTIAGPDGKYLPADAVIEGQTIVLSNPEVTEPRSAEYAETPMPFGCDVYNQAGLPLAPFRTGAPE
jgi:sialate O-acetylesterase